MNSALVGPSGVGKNTLIKMLVAEDRLLRFSTSHTTRAPKPGEQDGIDYHFVSKGVFRKMELDGKFLEHAEIDGQYYGTSWLALGSQGVREKDVILDIDCQGAQKLKKKRDLNIHLIFILPPSYRELERRLRARGRERDDHDIGNRLARAVQEIQQVEQFHYWIEAGGSKETTVIELKELIQLLRQGDKPPAERFRNHALLDEVRSKFPAFV